MEQAAEAMLNSSYQIRVYIHAYIYIYIHSFIHSYTIYIFICIYIATHMCRLGAGPILGSS